MPSRFFVNKPSTSNTLSRRAIETAAQPSSTISAEPPNLVATVVAPIRRRASLIASKVVVSELMCHEQSTTLSIVSPGFGSVKASQFHADATNQYKYG